MGKQSSRLIYRGKDIKDLIYKDEYLEKLYKGNDLVWEKLYRYFVKNGYLEVFDWDKKEYLGKNNYKYSILKLKKGPTHAIAIMQNIEEKRFFFAISYDMLRWKEIKELEHRGTVGGYSTNYNFMASYGGFFLQITNFGNPDINALYFIEIDYDLKYKLSKITSNVYSTISMHGVSDYFYGITHSKAQTFMLYRIWKNGKVESKQLRGPFIANNVNMGPMSILADGNGNTFIICDEIGAINGGTRILKVENMKTELVYTAFMARGSELLNGSVCDIDIVYDSYQTMFIAHRGFAEEKEFVEGRRGKDGYYNMEFYKIDSMGNTVLVSQKRDAEINVKCYGIQGRDYLTIKFGGKEDDEYKGADHEGIIYFYNIKKGISSSTGERDFTSVIFNYEKMQNDAVFVGEYSWKDGYTEKARRVVVLIDNLLLNESKNNFIVVTKWD